MFGFDLKVINVTKDAIWARDGVISDDAAPATMDPRWFVPPGEKLPEKIALPAPTRPRVSPGESRRPIGSRGAQARRGPKA